MGMFNRNSQCGYCAKKSCWLLGLFLFTACISLPLTNRELGQAVAAPAFTDDNPANAHIMRRLNSRERAAAIEEAARIEAAAQKAREENSDERRKRETRMVPAPVPALFSPPSQERAGGVSVASSSSLSRKSGKPDSFRRPSMTEVVFNYGASLIGIPGLASQQEVRAGASLCASGLAEPGCHPDAAFWRHNDSLPEGYVLPRSKQIGGVDDFDPLDMALNRGLGWSMDLVNAAGEEVLSSLTDEGHARLSFQMNRNGFFNGEGDAFLPLYDSARTTMYTQFGARSMHDSGKKGWIGNFGLGQRWFPLATGMDPKAAEYSTGNLMVGYNAFFDSGFTRERQRGGVGAELQCDWFHLSSNYYFPLSRWKGTDQSDKHLTKEQPARGYDARVKAHLPFYRRLVLTGVYAQWRGDQVGMLGHSQGEKNPTIWSYGIEYTPVPLLSGFLSRKSAEQGYSDTEFGLNFTCPFQMLWQDPIKPATVLDLPDSDMAGARHAFIDRENKTILKYKLRNPGRFNDSGSNRADARKTLPRLPTGFDVPASGWSNEIGYTILR